MKKKLDCKGLWWTPNNNKIFGTLTFDENNGGILSVYGDFPSSSESEDEPYRYPIILGETEDEELFTLQNCSLITSHPYLKILRESKIKVDNIFVGHHFESEDSIQFEKVSVVFSNINNIMRPIAGISSFGKKMKVIDITIADTCNIQVFAKSYVVTDRSRKKTSLETDSNIEISSLVEKTFDKYIQLYNASLDFFNFFICDDVDIVSVTGFYKEPVNTSNEYTHVKNIMILYRYPNLSGMNKPVNNVDFYIEQKYCLYLPQLLSKWYEVYLSQRLQSVLNLYFAVMVSGSDLFLEFQFLSLAQALEVYHSLTIGNASVFRMSRIEDAEKIKKIIGEHMPDKENWVNEMLSGSVNPSLQERVGEIFDCYRDFCFAYLKFNRREDLVNKIRDTRHYFSHWSNKLKRKSAKDDDLYWLMKDTQFILRLCILSELGIGLPGLKLIFFLEEMIEIRKIREKGKVTTKKEL